MRDHDWLCTILQRLCLSAVVCRACVCQQQSSSLYERNMACSCWWHHHPDTHPPELRNCCWLSTRRVYLPVFVEGANLSMGDMHFSQGDGEVRGDLLIANGCEGVLVRVYRWSQATRLSCGLVLQRRQGRVGQTACNKLRFADAHCLCTRTPSSPRHCAGELLWRH